MTLAMLPCGSRFRLDTMPEISGTLLSISDSRCVVKLDRAPKVVDFEDSRTGEWVRFVRAAGYVTSWSPFTQIERA